METNDNWTTETIYQKGDDYFAAVSEAIDTAKKSVDIEMYMFCNDGVGREIATRLAAAVKRGIEVHVIVDGIGSLGWINSFGRSFEDAGISFKVYHQMFWERFHSKKHPHAQIPGILKLIGQSNKRTHRKLIIIDKTSGFVGSRNFSAAHSEKISGSQAWRDVNVKVEGEAVADLVYAFNRSWVTSPPHREWKRMFWQRRKSFSPLVHLNVNRKLRKRNFKAIIRQMAEAKNRIYLITGYFVPSKEFLEALKEAANRGIDVRILLPLKSDVFFIPWVASLVYPALIEANVKIFQYTPSIMHTKAAIIDDWIAIGSNNLNYRSLVHDLEVNVALVKKESLENIIHGFEDDLAYSEIVTKETLKKAGFFRYAFGNIAALFKYWM